jgi:hypothetical protein
MGEASSLGGLASVAHSEGDHASARKLYAESLKIHQGLGDRRGVAGVLKNLGYIALDLGRPGPATSIFAADDHLRQEIAMPRAARDKERYDRSLAAARAALGGDDDFDRAWREGHEMSVDEAITFALRETVGEP